jgi:hypothetical protein
LITISINDVGASFFLLQAEIENIGFPVLFLFHLDLSLVTVFLGLGHIPSISSGAILGLFITGSFDGCFFKHFQ